MTPKEFKAVCWLIERASFTAYVKGREAESGKLKPLKQESFSIDAAGKLHLQSFLRKNINSR